MSLTDVIACSIWSEGYRAPQATVSYEPVMLHAVPPPPCRIEYARKRCAIDVAIVRALKEVGSSTLFGVWARLRSSQHAAGAKPEREQVANALARLIANKEVRFTPAGRYEAT